MGAATRDWDAASYERLSAPQEAWAREVLGRLALSGSETVIDAGCGSGRVTRLLIERLPAGRVIAVDGSASMIELVRAVLRAKDEAILSDLLSLELAAGADAVFSNAAFHWVSDHETLFVRLRDALRSGGRLVAQCGGQGNVAEISAAIREVNESAPFSHHLGGTEDPWNFASAERTSARLGAAGFADVRCWLEQKRVVPEEPRAYAETICLGAELGELPQALRPDYVDAVLTRCQRPLTLDYVRLNIEAERP